MSSTRSRRSRGFSLVELLVVVVIIALLIAILLPALAAVKQRGAKLKSETMLRRVLDSCQAYSLDFDGAMPGYVDDSALGSISDSFTATENMVVSLMGGFVDGTGDIQLPPDDQGISNSQLGSGPEDEAGRTLEPYFSPQKGELRKVSGTAGGDDPNPIKTLVDPQNGLPVLYFRKQRGYSRPVSSGVNGGAFALSLVSDYTDAAALEGADGRPFDQAGKSLLAADNARESLAWTAVNPTLSNLDNGPNNDSDDVVGGAVLLLAAGDDGIYLNKNTADPIDNRGQLDSFDDAFATGAGN